MNTDITQKGFRLLLPFLIVIGSSIALFFLYSLFFEGESFIPSPRGPWIDSGPPLWINWSSAEIIQEILKTATLPLWTNKVGIGIPLLADPHLSYFSPFSFILYLFPNSYGWDAYVLSKAILTITFSYFLALRLNLNPWLSAWAAVLFGFSGHIYQFLHHFHTNSLVFAPLYLIAILDIIDKHYRRGLVLIAISLPLMIFGGGLLDVILLSVLTGFISIIYFFISTAVNSEPYAIRVRHIGMILLISVLSIMIAAIWIVPYLELRALAIPPRPGRSLAEYNHLWYMFGVFVKNSMYTELEYSHWFMKQVQYLSIIALPGFIFGLFSLLTTRSRYQYFYLGLLVLILLQHLKVYGFPFIQIVEDIPILQDIRYEKYTGIYTLGFYLISGYGYQNLVDKSSTKNIWVFLVTSLLVVGLLMGYIYQYQLEWSRDLSIYLLLIIFPFVMLIIWRYSHSKFSITSSIVILLCSGMVLFQVYIDTDTRFDKRMEMFLNDDIVAAAKKISSSKRFFLLSGGGPRTWSADGLNDVRDISVAHVDRYHKVFKKIIEKDHKCWHNFVLCSNNAEKIYLEGLRWIGVDTLILSKKQLDDLQKNVDKNWLYAGSFNNYHFVTLRNVDPLVSIFTSSQIDESSPSMSRILESLEKGNHKIFLEDANFELPPSLKEAQWKIVNYDISDMSISVDIESDQAGFMLVKQQYYPGWEAKVSGERERIYQANYLFQAIPIPKGRSEVRLVYKPKSVLYGALISILAILLLMLMYRYQGRIMMASNRMGTG